MTISIKLIGLSVISHGAFINFNLNYPFDCRKPPLPYLAAGLANKNALNQRYIHPHLTLVVPKVPANAKFT
jgi:hypothetical protein